ncbi:MAG: hypothetical protein C4334_07525 [Pyrinomonas sp.]|uniref:hypothetical protein n=1 Tax=Pyrinomonas sp. TaxID=2080306 RepID=UPI0033345EBB
MTKRILSLIALFNSPPPLRKETPELTKRIFSLIVLCCLLLVFNATAQTRRRKTTEQHRTSSSQSRSAASTARARIGAQAQTIARFLYLYGRVSSEIEMAAQQARRDGNAGDLQSIENSKKVLLDSLRNVREGLERLETELRVSAASLFPRVAGVADQAAMAEEQAVAGQFDRAGRTLLGILERLIQAMESP